MQDEKYERMFGRMRNQKKDEKHSKNFEGAAFEKDESLMPK
jgi:hypothetical protein